MNVWSICNFIIKKLKFSAQKTEELVILKNKLVSEIWHFENRGGRLSTPCLDWLICKKAGTFEKLRDTICDTWLGKSRAPPHHTLPAFLHLNSILFVIYHICDI